MGAMQVTPHSHITGDTGEVVAGTGQGEMQ